MNRDTAYSIVINSLPNGEGLNVDQLIVVFEAIIGRGPSDTEGYDEMWEVVKHQATLEEITMRKIEFNKLVKKYGTDKATKARTWFNSRTRSLRVTIPQNCQALYCIDQESQWLN